MSNEASIPTVKPPKGDHTRKVRIIIRDSQEKHFAAITVYDVDPKSVEETIRGLFLRRPRRHRKSA